MSKDLNSSQHISQARNRKADWFDGTPATTSESVENKINSVNKKIDWFDGTVTDIPCSSNINSTETIIDDWYNLNLESQGGSYHKCQSNSTSLNNYQQKTTFDTSIKIDSNEKINTKTSGFGFIKLLEISKLEPGEIFLKFNIQHKYFINLLNEDLKPDKIVVLVKCLAKLCDIKFDKSKETILAEICNSNVLKSIEKYMYSLPSTPFSEKRLNQYFWKDVEDFWHNLLRFMTEIIEILPKQAKMLLPSIINTLKNTLEDLETHHKEKISFDLYKNFIKIQENLTSTLEMNFSDKMEKKDFQIIDVFPSLDEISKPQKPFIRPNIINGAYQSVEDYLDIQFRLMREDFISPLREAVTEFLKNCTKYQFDNIKIYPNAHLVGYGVSKEATGLKLIFNPLMQEKNLKYINDETFMYGSLLLLLETNFQYGYFLTVESRDNILAGEIIALPQGFNPDHNTMFNKNYILIESKIYFPPYYHVLKGLQHSSLIKKFPMSNYFIDAKTSKNPPDYININTEYILPNLEKVNLLKMEEWPNLSNIFDESQYSAFKMGLTQEFSTIQGPPGTGKTYIGLKIAETIISNKKNKPPLLVLCYTNHALDQFLEKLLTKTQNIIRVGGQSSNKELDGFNLKHTHKNSQFKQLKESYYKLLQTIRNICTTLELLKSENHIVNISKFVHIVNFPFDDFIEKFQLKNNQLPIVNWLLTDKAIETPKLFYNLTDNVTQIKEIDKQTIDNNPNISNKEIHDSFYDLNDFIKKQKAIKLMIDSKEFFKKHNCNLLELKQYYDKLDEEVTFLKTQLKSKLTRKLNNLPSKKLPAEMYTVHERWALYWSWHNQIYNSLNDQLHIMIEKYKEIKISHEEMSSMLDLQALKTADVVGFTTSGAAKYNNLIKILGSSTVIVEEAAEILESHIIVSLPEACKHLILIGDHQQLRPTTASYKLSKHFKLDISLFERMVHLERNCCQLNVQHRMRPEIAALISPFIYKNLQNHISVAKYENIKGMKSSLFFFNHQYLESRANYSNSPVNVEEAKLCLALAKYLLQQDYNSKEITILSAYTGQMLFMKEERKKDNLLSSIHITVLDNYQGEENEIIILSLVRNNHEKNVGFLSISNRICVALSRAKKGLYIFGNMEHLKESNELWRKIESTLESQSAIGSSLKLCCSIHPEVITEVTNSKNFENCPNGGCDRVCGAILNCGHVCNNICHISDRDHKIYKCEEECLAK